MKVHKKFLAILLVGLVAAPALALADDDDDYDDDERSLTQEQAIMYDAQESFAESIGKAARLECAKACAEDDEVFEDCIFGYLRMARRESVKAARVLKIPTQRITPDLPSLSMQIREEVLDVVNSCNDDIDDDD